MNFFEMLLNFIYPSKCGICEKICDDFICPNCKNNIEKLEFNKLKKFLVRPLDEHFYIFKYEGIIRQKIINYKFNDKAFLYNFFLRIILKNKKVYCFIKKYDIIIPVPVHKKRKNQRGYNQTELIARKIAQNIDDVEYLDNCLIKTKNTKPQSKLKENERKHNLIGVYEVNNKLKIKNKKILLFDDVYTTGSTANECSKALKEAGAEEVGILSIAKD